MFSEFWWGLSRFLISLVWTQFYLWKFLIICCSTCQRSENSLFQWNSPVFCSDQCFLDFSEGFRKKWCHLPRQSSVCKSCSVFVAELVKEAKTCCCVGILKVFLLWSVFSVFWCRISGKLLNASVLNWSEWRISIFSNSRSPLCSDWNRSYEITLRPNVRFGSGLSGFPVFGRRFHRNDLHCVLFGMAALIFLVFVFR